MNRQYEPLLRNQTTTQEMVSRTHLCHFEEMLSLVNTQREIVEKDYNEPVEKVVIETSAKQQNSTDLSLVTQ